MMPASMWYLAGMVVYIIIVGCIVRLVSMNNRP
jgi:hypothetical protein